MFIIGCFAVGVWRVQAMTSTNYTIAWDSLNAGGNEMATSTSYKLRDSIGQLVSGGSGSTSYLQSAGYRLSDDLPTLSLVTRAAAGSDIAYTGFDAGAHTVTVSPASFHVGDLIAVVENQGFHPTIAIGKVISTTPSAVQVDAWEGQPGLMSSVPSGGNDFVYLLSSNTDISLNVIRGQENTTLVGVSIQSSAPNGQTVYLQGESQLTDGSTHVLPDVIDGDVSSNADEYGIRSLGTHAVAPTQDVAVATTTGQAILQSAIPAPGTPDRIAVLFKAGATAGTPTGSYTQRVFFTLTPNF